MTPPVLNVPGGRCVCVARLVQIHRLPRVRRVDDAVEHRQRLSARDATTQVRLQHLVVHGWEVPVDVAPQNVAMTVAQPLVARQRPVRPLPRPVGVQSPAPRSPGPILPRRASPG